MTPEGKEKAKVRKYLNSLWCTYQLWPVPSGYGRSGVDCYACIYGKFLAIEVKAPGKKPTPRQFAELEAVAGAGGFIAHGTADEIIQAIENVSRRTA
jgi:hypothetical protein